MAKEVGPNKTLAQGMLCILAFRYDLHGDGLCPCTHFVYPAYTNKSLFASQINSVSLLDKTLSQSIQILEKITGTLNLLVCAGYNPKTVSYTIPIDKEKLHLSNGNLTAVKIPIPSKSKLSDNQIDAHKLQLLNGN